MSKRATTLGRLVPGGALSTAGVVLMALALHGGPVSTPAPVAATSADPTATSVASPGGATTTGLAGTAAEVTTGTGANGAASTTSATQTDTAASVTRQTAADAAVAYAQNLGYRTGIAIVDTQTGQVTTAGSATGYFPTESTVKVLLAANLLAHGEMTGELATTAAQMVQASDDDDADALYYLAGGDDVVGWAAARYGITGLGTAPVNGAGQWGSTQVSPLGMATFLADAKADPVVGPWLTSNMAQMHSIADDGTNQVFGLKAADPSAWVKQGWGGDVPGMNAETTPSIGYVDNGRYAIAIYTLHTPEVAQSTVQATVTHQAELLLPGGQMPAL